MLSADASERLAQAAERVVLAQPQASDLAAALRPHMSTLVERKLSGGKLAALAEMLLVTGAQPR